MKKLLLVGALLCSFFGKSQFSQSDLIYYVGSGPDTAVLVVDFIDGTPDSTYAWGYLFDATQNVTASTMIADIANDEPTLSVNISGGFLLDINYNAHSGIGGSPNYFGTWTKTASTAWGTNGGISDTLSNGLWFGCSYTDFTPPVGPGEPIPAYDSKKWNAQEVDFWVGSGTDSAVFVVDFVNDTYGEAVTYSWGYLFSGTTTGTDMMTDIAAADPNLNITFSGSFLWDVTYNGLEGLGANPNYWGTWSGTNLTDWTMNSGATQVVNPGDWYGISYDTWPSRRPFYPIAAIDSSEFVAGDIDFWVGTGADSAVIVMDFNEANDGESFAFGFLFDASSNVTASDALNALAAADPSLDVAIAGNFLNDITYGSNSGIGGSPYYWGTWSATNAGGWEMNGGIGDTLSNGSWFGCSYTSWGPATPPSLPEAATDVTGLNELNGVLISSYPNPMDDVLEIDGGEGQLALISLNGKVLVEKTHLNHSTLDVSSLPSGVYLLVIENNGSRMTQKIVK